MQIPETYIPYHPVRHYGAYWARQRLPDRTDRVSFLDGIYQRALAKEINLLHLEFSEEQHSRQLKKHEQ